jgi:hypothetical protein
MWCHKDSLPAPNRRLAELSPNRPPLHIGNRPSDAFGIKYVFTERRKTATAVRADFREKSLKVFAHHLDDFIVGHGAKGS